jgi:NAD-dependent deacetylase
MTLNYQNLLQDAAELMRGAHKIVTLTGAGISTESGIPDFRSPGSIWQRQPPVSYQEFISNTEARRQYWAARHSLSRQVVTAKPNAAHYALAKLEHRHMLLGVITQNFDGLHQDAGHTPERVIELHGTSRLAACTLCGQRSSMTALQQRIDAGEQDPQCTICGGYMKAATILFGQRVPEADLSRARMLTEECDLFLVVGSSLKVTPAATLPRRAIHRNIPLIIVNLQPTPFDNEADVVIHEQAGQVLPSLLGMV